MKKSTILLICMVIFYITGFVLGVMIANPLPSLFVLSVSFGCCVFGLRSLTKEGIVKDGTKIKNAG